MIILVPMAYYVQEMTVRLGAVTKRGHAEAIFDGFGKFWGWFSIFDLAVINWLTLVTEYIGMTQAMSLFNIPPWVTFFGVTALLTGNRDQRAVLDVRENHALFLPLQPGLYPRRVLGDAHRERPGRLERGGKGLLPSEFQTRHVGRGVAHADHGEHRHDHHARGRFSSSNPPWWTRAWT